MEMIKQLNLKLESNREKCPNTSTRNTAHSKHLTPNFKNSLKLDLTQIKKARIKKAVTFKDRGEILEEEKES